MDLMLSVYDTYLSPKEGQNGCDEETLSYRKQVEPIMELVRDQREKLAREVERWCKERGV